MARAVLSRIRHYGHFSAKLGNTDLPGCVTLIETSTRFKAQHILSTRPTTATMAYVGMEGLTVFLPQLFTNAKAVVRFENSVTSNNGARADFNNTDLDLSRDSPLEREIVHLRKVGFSSISPFETRIGWTEKCSPTCPSQLGNKLFMTVAGSGRAGWDVISAYYRNRAVPEQIDVACHAKQSLGTTCSRRDCEHWDGEDSDDGGYTLPFFHAEDEMDLQ